MDLREGFARGVVSGPVACEARVSQFRLLETHDRIAPGVATTAGSTPYSLAPLRAKIFALSAWVSDWQPCGCISASLIWKARNGWI